ncbi:hypothetical protein CCH79_00015825 [Gambusia affinis]|uniref:Calx-beta domain-containing protein n=1 Tax=Gambusia affinis TaxID=33528 RepID=A0A315UQ97_GAMAF|nr:hypothetical protein CCH79_00015825 [Gambusia affinis]
MVKDSDHVRIAALSSPPFIGFQCGSLCDKHAQCPVEGTDAHREALLRNPAGPCILCAKRHRRIGAVVGVPVRFSPPSYVFGRVCVCVQRKCCSFPEIELQPVLSWSSGKCPTRTWKWKFKLGLCDGPLLSVGKSLFASSCPEVSQSITIRFIRNETPALDGPEFAFLIRIRIGLRIHFSPNKSDFLCKQTRYLPLTNGSVGTNTSSSHAPGPGLTINMGFRCHSSALSPVLRLAVVTVILLLKPRSALAGTAPEHSLGSSVSVVSTNKTECSKPEQCTNGVLLPVWEPRNPSFGDKVARATVYFVALVYMFLGVSIIADRFMASIEVITSQEKEITIKKPNGETTTTTVRIWNETVSNLTLMALGSSAPEILLSIIEIIGHGFEAGTLGPSTIVGSAAFNMFVIIGLCVYVVPDGETRKVKHLRVFFVTATWSIFAYIWLYLILSVISPGVVQIWEGLLTFLFFPICVVFAWVADRRLLFYKYVYKRYRTGKQRGMIIETEGDRPLPSKVDIEMDGKMLNSHGVDFLDGPLGLDIDEKDLDEGETRRDMAKILKELKQKHPDKEVEQLIELANYQVLSQQQKSRAFYRCQATRLMTGAGNILKKHAADQARKAVSMHEVRSDAGDNDPVSKIFFEPGSYQCLENCGTVAVNVVRRGGDLGKTVSVEYRTEDGTANAGSDYEFTEGVVVFKPGETTKEIRVGIIDDDIFEEDENFLIHLSNVKVLTSEGEEPEENESANHVDSVACIGIPSTATVTIFDDDHAGIFTFEEPVCHVSESVGTMEVKVLRTSGARGVVMLPYKTVEGTARGNGEDFEDSHGVLEFQNDEIL